MLIAITAITATTIILGSNLFNIYLIKKGITSCKKITPSLIEPFLDLHLSNFQTTCLSYCPKTATRGNLKILFSYLIEVGVIKPVKLRIKRTQYSSVLEPYIQHLRDECDFTEGTIQKAREQLCPFLER